MTTLAFDELNRLLQGNKQTTERNAFDKHIYIKVSTCSLISVDYSITQDHFNYVKSTLSMNAIVLFKNSALVVTF